MLGKGSLYYKRDVHFYPEKLPTCGCGWPHIRYNGKLKQSHDSAAAEKAS
jgi:hypothetical protein